MRAKLSRVLDECIERIGKGESLEACLAEYPDLRERLEPLLHIALSVSALPKAEPSKEFRKASKARLMARIRQESAEAGQKTAILDELVTGWQRLWQAISGARKIAIPVTVAVLVALTLFVRLDFLSPYPVTASECTLSILGGGVEIQKPGLRDWRQGTDGITLAVGTRVKTALDSHALLTFFDGSTIKLETNTEVEIRQIEHSDDQSTTVVMKQWLGRTWSQVAERADSGSYYQIETPTASAIAYGTLFTTEVDVAGFTTVATTEGLVGVLAKGEEVLVPPDHQTLIGVGIAPSEPAITPSPQVEIVISIDMPGVGSVSDPNGSSTGYLPDGFAYNQITGSQSSSPAEGTQVITIPQPVTGEYTLALRYLTSGTAKFTIQGKSADEVVFEYTGTHESKNKSDWLINLDLKVDDGFIVDSDISEVEPVRGGGPEKVVVTKVAKERAEAVKLSVEDKVKGPDEDKVKGPDEDKVKGPDEDKVKG
ncbi:FecR domain-containing protein, partial [Chloroflexota bacterium]